MNSNASFAKSGLTSRGLAVLNLLLGIRQFVVKSNIEVVADASKYYGNNNCIGLTIPFKYLQVSIGTCQGKPEVRQAFSITKCTWTDPDCVKFLCQLAATTAFKNLN